METWDEQKWAQGFFLRKSTFLEPCGEAHPGLGVPAERGKNDLEACSLWKLANPNCYRSVHNQFRVVKSMAGSVVMEVCKAVIAVLHPRMVKLEIIP